MNPYRARELLRAERERVERALGEKLHEDDGSPGEVGDQGERNEGLRQGFQAQLAAVERAEARLAAGSYGRSIRSGEPIPDERLEACPTAELTVEEERADAALAEWSARDHEREEDAEQAPPSRYRRLRSKFHRSPEYERDPWWAEVLEWLSYIWPG